MATAIRNRFTSFSDHMDVDLGIEMKPKDPPTAEELDEKTCETCGRGFGFNAPRSIQVGHSSEIDKLRDAIVASQNEQVLNLVNRSVGILEKDGDVDEDDRERVVHILTSCLGILRPVEVYVEDYIPTLRQKRNL